MSEKAEYRLGVHASHCCETHGCKYGDDDCPVERKEVAAKYKCEQCDWEEEEDRRNPRMQALNAEIAILRAALVKYARHINACPVGTPCYGGGTWPCDCGLDELLSRYANDDQTGAGQSQSR